MKTVRLDVVSRRCAAGLVLCTWPLLAGSHASAASVSPSSDVGRGADLLTVMGSGEALRTNASVETSRPRGAATAAGAPTCTGSEVVYRYDDSSFEGGLRTDGTHGAWLNNFVVDNDADVIEAIDLTFVFVPEGLPATVYLWSDPNGDGDPTDAQVLASAPTLTVDSSTSVFRVDIPDTFVGPAGTSFFVGVAMAYPAPIPDFFPCPIDTTLPATTGVGWLVGANAPVDPNDLTNGAIEFALVEDAIATDVNIGVRAVSRGSVDCNDNGTPDHEDINMGTSLDCDGNCTPDECELVGNDCNMNGIPDQCDLGGPPVPQYVLDDGVGDDSVGLIDGGDIAWLNHFTVLASGETINGVRVAYGAVPLGTPATVYLWDDPNGDGGPADAQVIASANTTVQAPGTDALNFVALPDTFVGPAGTSFFVGVLVAGHAMGEFPARIDQTTDQGESWVSGGSAPVDPNDLSASSLFGTTAGAGVPGNWMVRAASDAPTPPNDCNGNGIPDTCEIDDGTGEDCNGNGVLDECELAAGMSDDCDGNGVPDECDPDCDGDGIPDACDSPVVDCDGNGIDDFCQTDGNGLVGAYYGNRYFLGAPLVTRLDPNVNLQTDDTPPAPVPSDLFGVRWTGSIVPPTTGMYTLIVDHDDGFGLFLNGEGIMSSNGTGTDSTTVMLDGGVAYHLRLDYFDVFFGNRCILRWIPPGGVEEVVPSSVLVPGIDANENGIPDICDFGDCNGNGVPDNVDVTSGSSLDCDGNGVPDECQPGCDCDGDGLLDSCGSVGTGLVGQYFSSEGGPGLFSERLLVRIDPIIDFDWGGGSPDPAVPNDPFSVRWTGTVTTTSAAGLYTFYTRTDDGARLWVDGQLLIDEWQPQGPTEHSGAINLAANTAYLIKMEYREDLGGAEARLSWEPPGEAKVVIPTEALGPASDADGDGVPDTCVPNDCNDNGMADLDEIAMGLSEDCNANCVPDECDLEVPPFDFGQAHWRFEEGGGTTVLDAGPNGLDGTLNARPSRVSDTPVDPVPQSGLVNGQSLDLGWQSTTSGGFFTAPDTGGALTMGNQSFTIEAWVKLDHISDASDANERQYLCQKKVLPSQDGQIDYAVLVQRGTNVPTTSYGNVNNGRQLQVVFGTGAGTSTWGVTSSLEISDLAWHFVSVGFDADVRQVTFRVDSAIDIVSFPGGNPRTTNAGPLRVGSHQNGVGTNNFFLRGSIDEFRISRGLVPFERQLDAVAPVTSEDGDGNGTPDECQPTTCPADIDGDGIVGFSDLVLVLSQWGACPGCPEDLNDDDAVGFDDLILVLSAWGDC